MKMAILIYSFSQIFLKNLKNIELKYLELRNNNYTYFYCKYT